MRRQRPLLHTAPCRSGGAPALPLTRAGATRPWQDTCFALPFHFPSGPAEFAADSFLRLTRELNRLDNSFAVAVQDAGARRARARGRAGWAAGGGGEGGGGGGHPPGPVR